MQNWLQTTLDHVTACSIFIQVAVGITDISAEPEGEPAEPGGEAPKMTFLGPGKTGRF